MYEEHTNADVESNGSQKEQSFELRLDHGNPPPKRGKQKKHWKLDAKKPIKPEADDNKSCSGQTEDQDFEPVAKL